jgi:hypothetical protein
MSYFPIYFISAVNVYEARRLAVANNVSSSSFRWIPSHRRNLSDFMDVVAGIELQSGTQIIGEYSKEEYTFMLTRVRIPGVIGFNKNPVTQIHTFKFKE